MQKLPIALLLAASIALPVHAQYAAVDGDLVSEPAGVVSGSQPDRSAGDCGRSGCGRARGERREGGARPARRVLRRHPVEHRRDPLVADPREVRAHRRGADDVAVAVRGMALRHQHALAPAGRAAHEVGARRGPAVVLCQDPLRELRHPPDRLILYADALGLAPAQVLGATVSGPRPDQAVGALRRLGSSTALVPLEGYRFLALSSGPVGNPAPAGGGELSGRTFPDPMPEFMGAVRSNTRTGMEPR